MRKIIALAAIVTLLWSSTAKAVSIMYTFQSLSELSSAGTLATLKGMNIDVVMNYYYTDNDSTINSARALLDAYRDAGLKGMVRLGPSYTQKVMGSGDYTALATFINALKDHPALYGWYAYDEPAYWNGSGTAPSNAFPVPQLTTVHDYIKAQDPNHPVVIVYPGYGTGFYPPQNPVSNPDGLTAYPYSTATHDLFAIDTYPINGSGTYGWMNQAGGVYPYTLAGFTSSITDSYSSVATGDRGNLFFVEQVYVPQAGTSYPTAQQITDMHTAAKNAGWTGKGIAFWMWYWHGNSGVTTLSQNTAAQATVAGIAAQYHEDLYGGGAPTITATSSTATNKCAFK